MATTAAALAYRTLVPDTAEMKDLQKKLLDDIELIKKELDNPQGKSIWFWGLPATGKSVVAEAEFSDGKLHVEDGKEYAHYGSQKFLVTCDDNDISNVLSGDARIIFLANRSIKDDIAPRSYERVRDCFLEVEVPMLTYTVIKPKVKPGPFYRTGVPSTDEMKGLQKKLLEDIDLAKKELDNPQGKSIWLWGLPAGGKVFIAEYEFTDRPFHKDADGKEYAYYGSQRIRVSYDPEDIAPLLAGESQERVIIMLPWDMKKAVDYYAPGSYEKACERFLEVEAPIIDYEEKYVVITKPMIKAKAKTPRGGDALPKAKTRTRRPIPRAAKKRSGFGSK